jgi:putative transposase
MAKRCRKKHVQVELQFHRRGGKRRGAGRKRRAARRQVPHTRRTPVNARHPQHVTLRVLDNVGRLRRRSAFRLVRQAMLLTARRKDFRIVHVSVQGNHIHLICEAANATALGAGMKGFKTSLARRINRVLGRHGPVFEDRYHIESLSSVRQVRNAICYVLNNWRRHGEDRGATSCIDPFSTACHYKGWTERDPFRYRRVDVEDILPEHEPQTWLLREGWKRAAPISVWERPGRA